MRRMIGSMLALLFIACSQPTRPTIRQVEFSVRTSEFATGDTLSATLTNRSDMTVVYSFCPVSLEHKIASGWSTVQMQFGRHEGALCAAMAFGLLPGGVAEYRHIVPSGFAAGLYRLRMEVGIGSAVSSLYSSEFRILQ